MRPSGSVCLGWLVGTTLLWNPYWEGRAVPAARGEEPSPATASEPPASSAADPKDDYYELLQLFAETLDQVERNYVRDVSRRDLIQAAIDGMLAKLDEHTDYIPPDQLEQFRSSVENQFGGIGIQVSIKNGQLDHRQPLAGYSRLSSGPAGRRCDYAHRRPADGRHVGRRRRAEVEGRGRLPP